MLQYNLLFKHNKVLLGIVFSAFLTVKALVRISLCDRYINITVTIYLLDLHLIGIFVFNNQMFRAIYCLIVTAMSAMNKEIVCRFV